MATFVNNTEFVVEDCCNCGMQFAMTRDFYRRVYADHSTFHCPKGHPQHYTGKTEEQKLREQLERQQRLAEEQAGRAIAAIDQLNEVKKSSQRMRARIRNGVCPCCNRAFQNLMDHMKHQHPEFGKPETLRTARDMFGLTQKAVAKEIGVLPSYVSLYENGRAVPGAAEKRIESWLERQV